MNREPPPDPAIVGLGSSHPIPTPSSASLSPNAPKELSRYATLLVFLGSDQKGFSHGVESFEIGLHRVDFSRRPE